MKLALVALFIAAIVTACGKDRPPSHQPSKQPAANESTSVDEWLGQWNGPEGTFLLLSKNGAHYEVKIQSLDGPASYLGMATGDRIEFERNGVRESIRATDGKATGMKWLQDKTECLTIRSGEGFCRR